jgi:hypothetical protein
VKGWDVSTCPLLISSDFREIVSGEVRRMPRMRTSPYRISANFARKEFTEVRARQEVYSRLYEP